jgi:hypothetical protein
MSIFDRWELALSLTDLVWLIVAIVIGLGGLAPMVWAFFDSRKERRKVTDDYRKAHQ